MTATTIGWIDNVPYELFVDKASDDLWEVLLKLFGIVELLCGEQLSLEQIEKLQSDPQNFKEEITANINLSHAIDAYIHVFNAYESLDQLIFAKNVKQTLQETENKNEL